MPSTRHFLDPERKNAVICEWDYRTGSWNCTSTGRKEPLYRSSDITPIHQNLTQLGYEEITPELPRKNS